MLGGASHQIVSRRIRTNVTIHFKTHLHHSSRAPLSAEPEAEPDAEDSAAARGTKRKRIKRRPPPYAPQCAVARISARESGVKMNAVARGGGGGNSFAVRLRLRPSSCDAGIAHFESGRASATTEAGGQMRTSGWSVCARYTCTKFDAAPPTPVLRKSYVFKDVVTCKGSKSNCEQDSHGM